MKVIVDPRSSYSYGSFYMEELKRLCNNNIRYDLSPFKGLGLLGNDMRFIIDNGGKQSRYFLHLNDSYQLIEQDYDWCDVYGCVNANYRHYPREQYPKLVSLVPSFGVRDSSLIERILTISINLCKAPELITRRAEWNKVKQNEEIKLVQNAKHYFGRAYKTWKNRLPLSAYNNDIVSEGNYMFFLSTLWYNDEWNKNDEGVNLRRANFVRACKSIPNCTFEGGLLGSKYSSNEKYADVLTSRGAVFPDWIKKTKRSALVFNTPAFWDCHGWKLGEYLALGKCIISTALSNDLPHPLEHGVNIHFVENSEESMREVVEYVLTHPDYRQSLEKGAREYWDTYGTPKASLKLLGIE